MLGERQRHRGQGGHGRETPSIVAEEEGSEWEIIEKAVEEEV